LLVAEIARCRGCAIKRSPATVDWHMPCRVIEAISYPEGGVAMTDVWQRTESEGKEPEHD